MFVHAYVDESYDLTIGVYILTASIVDLTDAEDLRCALRELHAGRQKLHWYKSDAEHREHLAKGVSALNLSHVSIVGRSQGLRPERARRKCMEVLLPRLESIGVRFVVFESRQGRNNRHDTDLIDACRRKKLISHLQATFIGGNDEPLLWLADIACGSALAAARGTDSYLTQFGDTVHLQKIDAT
ncbi:hypothetical protein LZ318_21705 [Saccharopolyspora indica]|uniref:hypothetical protein n=1 Tax=Saccharopolyspora indica TaxID=1229659 RepID=UPI0022EB2580|nr:hypothetical protein [Saccharopolyspora indica]MDA3646086.1 hypothetical protein [Saccharopolyspora indica]